MTINYPCVGSDACPYAEYCDAENHCGKDSREEQEWNHAVEEMEHDGHREYETEQEIRHEYESDGSPYWWEDDVSEIGYNPYMGCFDDDC